MLDKIVISMASLRLMSGSIEVIAALLILRFNQVEKALLINSGLALVGPLVFIAATSIGLIGIAEKLSFSKLIWVVLGVTCIFVGILKK